ncbi:hypothetical protein GCM10023082_12960 [Streptomyces tremellae]|uniref:NADP-dependent oxidoreductase domain-containing protein n=1 Tax=Streptomyces tremellae TaxID=1124239 RepID=A0ABP7ECV0_9ACTN
MRALAAHPGAVSTGLNRRLGPVLGAVAAAEDKAFDTAWLTGETRRRLRALNDIAARRGQGLAQLALAWALRDPRVTSLVIGASRVGQLEQNVAALDRLDFSEAALAEIDEHAVFEGSVDLWQRTRRGSLG